MPAAVSHGAYSPALELLAGLRAGLLSSETLVAGLLERIGRLNPSINAVVTLDAAAALSRARAADLDLRRGDSWGPLHGLPMTIKDCFEVAGMRAVCGAPALREYQPARHAPAVQRLLDAGAIVLGKTNVPMFSLDLETCNEVFGATRNPWNVARSPGGSSGGAAAALASGLTPAEIGTDLAGSLRLPAHYCGVCALKPSYGLVPVGGILAGPPGRLRVPDLVVAGPMARSVADVRLLFDVLSGTGEPQNSATPGANSRRPLRIAVWLDESICRVDSGVQRVLQQLVAKLSGAGVAVDSDARPAMEPQEYFRHFLQMLYGEMSSSFPESLYRAFRAAARQDSGVDWTPLTMMAAGAAQSHRDWLAGAEARERFRLIWKQFFAEFDVLLTPVGPTAAPAPDPRPFEQRLVRLGGADYPYMQQSFWAGLATAAYLPAATVPAGLDEAGMPVGVQLIGPHLGDRELLDAAELVERLTGGFRSPPDFP